MQLVDFIQMISTTRILIVCILRTNIGINYKLDETGLVGKNLLQGKSVYKDGGFFTDCF